MDNTIEQIFKVFSHLARDIQNYIFTGFIILANVYMIDYYYFGRAIWAQLSSLSIFIPCIIIAAYIIGHIALAFYTLIIESTRVDLFLYKNLFSKRFKAAEVLKEDELISSKIKFFKSHNETYFHFIEREYILSNIRWNYSAAFLICAICDSAFYFGVAKHRPVIIAAALSLFLSIILLLLSVFTHKENSVQLKSMNTLTPETNTPPRTGS